MPSNAPKRLKLTILPWMRVLAKFLNDNGAVQYDDFGEPVDLDEREWLFTEYLELVDKYFTSVPVELGKLKCLTHLSLDGNSLKELPTSIGELPFLRSLSICHNHISDLQGSFKHLDALYWSCNNLTTPPRVIRRLTNLELLDLADNELTDLPSSVGKWRKLVVLNVEYNKLTSLPKEIGFLLLLEELCLEQNKLTTLPKEIGFLTNLRSLELQANALTYLPAELGFLTGLQFLYLHENPSPIRGPIQIALPTLQFQDDDDSSGIVTRQALVPFQQYLLLRRFLVYFAFALECDMPILEALHVGWPLQYDLK